MDQTFLVEHFLNPNMTVDNPQYVIIAGVKIIRTVI